MDSLASRLENGFPKFRTGIFIQISQFELGAVLIFPNSNIKDSNMNSLVSEPCKSHQNARENRHKMKITKTYFPTVAIFMHIINFHKNPPNHRRE